jgi:hypothetical protein
MSNKAERLRKAYEFKLGKDFVSKLSDDQLKILSKYYNSLSDSEQSDLDNKIFKGHTDTDLHEMARGMMEEVEEEVAPPPPPPKVTAIVPSKFFGEGRYEKYIQEITENSTIDGQLLTPSERKEAFKKRKSKIDFKNFVDKVLEKKAEAAAIGGDGDTAAAPGARKSVVPEQILLPGTADLVPDLKPDKEEEKKTAEVKEDVDNIDEKLDTLLSEIREENKEEKKSTEKKRVEKERERRKKKENRLESAKKFLVAPITKALQPIGNIFQKIFDGILKLIFTKALIKLIDWFTDPSNKKKVDSIVRFIKDFWPAIIAGFLIIGSGLGGLVTSIMGVTAKLVLRLLGLTAKLGIAAARLAGRGLGKGLKFAAKNPLVAASIGTGIAAGALVMRSKDSSEQILEDRGKADASPKEQAEELSKPMNIMETLTRTMLPSLNEQEVEGRSGGGLIGFNGGGMKPMGTDTVPAMLTPGESVLQVGARERQIAATGVDPLDFNVGSNANRPKIMNGITYAASGGQMGAKQNKKMYLHWTAGGYSHRGGPYHSTIQGDGSVYRHAAYNTRTGHTEGRNTNSVGLSVAAMAGAQENNFGQYPAKQIQIDNMAKEAARIAKMWNWSPSDVNIKSVMTHAEAGSNKDGVYATDNYGPVAWGGTGERWDWYKTKVTDAPGTGGDKLRQKIKQFMGQPGALEIPEAEGSPSAAPGPEVAPGSGTGTLAPGSSTGDANAQALMSYLIRLSRLPSVGQQGMTPVSNIGATSQPIGTNGSDVPQLGSLDPNNNSLLVMKSMYNIVGS